MTTNYAPLLTMPKPESSKSDRDLQDEVIRYLADARARKKSSAELPLSPEQAQKAEKFGRFLARRYYRDRLARSFRYSRMVSSAIGRTAEQVVDGEFFQDFLNECVVGSLGAAQRVGQMAGVGMARVLGGGGVGGGMFGLGGGLFFFGA